MDSDPEPMRYYSILPNYHLAVQLTLDPRFYYYRASQANRDSYDQSLVLDCEMNAKSGYTTMRGFLETYGRPPEAVFIASDSIAPGAMRALRERGLRVPGDISIVTFNNTVLSEYSGPPLTSIELFMRENVRAATFCMQLLWQGNVRGKRIVVPCELVSRGSVAPVPTDNPPSEL